MCVAFGFQTYFHSRKILEIVASVFNEGFCTLFKMMEVMGLTIGPAAIHLARKQTDKRIAQANRRSTEASKDARIARKERRVVENEAYEESEGALYAADIAD